MKKTLLFYRAQIFILTFITQAVFSFTRVSWLHIQQFLIKDYYNNNDSLAKISDVVFLFCYGIFMTIFGAYAHRGNPKCFLVVGLFLSAFSNLAISIGLIVERASKNQLMFFTIMNSIGQSISWPACIAIMASWFPKRNISIIMALWVQCWDFGDFAGLLVASITNPPYYIILISATSQATIGMLDALYLIPHQEMILSTTDKPQHTSLMKQARRRRRNPRQIETIPEDSTITYWNALKTPNVVGYLLSMACLRCLFAGYFYWFPDYFKNQNLTYMVQLFDLGAFIGGIIIGYLCEKYNRKAFSIMISFTFGIGMMALFNNVYQKYKIQASFISIGLGFFQGGSYNTILGYIMIELSQQKNRREYTSLYTSLLIGIPAIIESFYLVVLFATEDAYKLIFMYVFAGTSIFVMFIQMILDFKNRFILSQ